MEARETLKAGTSLIGKVFRFLWLAAFLGFVGSIGGFYLEFRKLNSQIAEVRSMVDSLGKELVSGWKDKAATEIDKLKGQGGDILKKLGK